MIEKEYQYDKNGQRFNRMHDGYRDDLMLPKLNKHLKDVDETYFEHMYHALGYTLTFLLLTVTTLIHSVIPCLFVETGSKKIEQLNKHLSNRLDKDA